MSVLAGAGSPRFDVLAQLGVARISVGSGAYRATLGLARRMAEEVYGANTLDTMLSDQMPFGEIQALFAN